MRTSPVTAPSVALVAAGGTDDGGIGTSFVKVTSAIDEADAGAGVVALSDLGSALMIAETVHDQLPEEQRSRVVIADAPFVEAGVAAAVAAETRGDLGGVVAAAEGAREAWDGMSGGATLLRHPVLRARPRRPHPRSGSFVR